MFLKKYDKILCEIIGIILNHLSFSLEMLEKRIKAI